MSQSILSQDPRIGQFTVSLFLNEFLEPLRWILVVIATPKIAPYLTSKPKA
jgi:hypothetical protein